MINHKKYQSLFLLAALSIFSITTVQSTQTQSVSESLSQSQSTSFKQLKNVSSLEDIVRPGDWVVLDIDETLLKQSPSGLRLNLDPKASQVIQNWQQSYPESEKGKQIRVMLLTANTDTSGTRAALSSADFPESLEIIIAPNQNTAQGKIPTKGAKLVEELRKAAATGILPKRIIMVDDLAVNLENSQQALAQSEFKDIPYLPFQKQTSYKLYESAPQENYFPDQLKDLSYVRAMGGGSGGVHILKNTQGKQFTFKCVQDPEQIKEEITADGLYRSLDIAVPPFAVYDEMPNISQLKSACHGPGPYRLADFIDSAQSQDPVKIKSEMKQNFVADALLSNWDIVVGKFRNVILDPNGTLWRIDNGGSLRYRAIGDRKTPSQTWDPFKIIDLDTMRNPAISPEGARTYGDLTAVELKEQAQAIFNKRETLLSNLDEITTALHVTNPQELKEMLRRRLDDLAQRFQLTISVPPHKTSLRNRDYKNVPGELIIDKYAPYKKTKNLAATHRPAVDKGGAGILIYSKDPETGKLLVLLGKRIRHNWYSNFGGKSDVNMGEESDKTLADTAVREVQEESLGLLSFTPMELAKMPSHDIVNADGVLYRMYLAPHLYVDPQRFIDAAKGPQAQENARKYHWQPEYTDYMWMPLDEFLQGIAENKRITEESKNTLQINNISIFPPFAEMLQEPEIQQSLHLLAEGKPVPARHTVRERDRVLIQPLTLDQEKERLAETVVQHAAVMGEMKKNSPQEYETPSQQVQEMRGYLSDDEANKIREELREALYSQTEAFLVTEMGKDKLAELKGDSKAEVKMFLSRYSKLPRISQQAGNDYKNALIAALSAEKLPQYRDKIVFYHAADPLTCFLYDLLSAFRAQLKIISPDKFRIFRGIDTPFATLRDVEAFIQLFTDSFGRISNYGYVNNTSYAELGLSVNPFLFGNDGIEGNCTYELFYSMKSIEPVDLEKFVNAFMAQTGIPGSFKDYKAIYHQFYERDNHKNAKLFQFFIDPQVVDTVAYTAITRGVVKPVILADGTEYYGFAKTMNEIRRDPNRFRELFKMGINEFQGRLFMKPEIFHNPLYVNVNTYWHHQPLPEIEKIYQTALNAQVKQDLSRWLSTESSSSPGVLGTTTPELKKLYQYVYEGKTGLKYTEEEAIQLLISALSKGDLDMIKKILDLDPKINLNQKIKNPDYRSGRKQISLVDLLPFMGGNNDKIIKVLVERGMIVDHTVFGLGYMDSDLYRFLITHLPQNRDLEQILLDNGSLTLACIGGDSQLIDLLYDVCKNTPGLFKKILLEPEFRNHRIPIQIALINNQTEIVKKILDLSKDDPDLINKMLSSETKMDKESLLHLAINKSNPNAEIVKNLLEICKSDPELLAHVLLMRNKNKQTALGSALRRDNTNTAIIDALKEAYLFLIENRTPFTAPLDQALEKINNIPELEFLLNLFNPAPEVVRQTFAQKKYSPFFKTDISSSELRTLLKIAEKYDFLQQLLTYELSPKVTLEKFLTYNSNKELIKELLPYMSIIKTKEKTKEITTKMTEMINNNDKANLKRYFNSVMLGNDQEMLNEIIPFFYGINKPELLKEFLSSPHLLAQSIFESKIDLLKILLEEYKSIPYALLESLEEGSVTFMDLLDNLNQEITKKLFDLYISKFAYEEIVQQEFSNTLKEAINNTNVDAVKLIINSCRQNKDLLTFILTYKNEQGETPIEAAQKSGNEEIVKILEEARESISG